MYYDSRLRHAALLVLFGLLLIIAALYDNVFDDFENSHAAELQEMRAEAHGVGTLLFASRAPHWRAAPLALNRLEIPYVADIFVSEYINRTVSPRLSDVRDVRTLTSKDLFEQVQLWRRPGRRAEQISKFVDSLTENERVAARAEAVRQRQHKSKTRRSAESLLSLLAGGGRGHSHDDDDAADSGAADDVVKVRYPSSLVLHYHGSSDLFSLTSNNVQLVPYPLVPPPVTTRLSEAAPPPHADVIGKKEFTGEDADERTAAAAANDTDTDSTITITIPKGKVRYAVPRRTAPHTPTHGWDHFYIALNLWKNEEVLPDLTEALIAFLEEEVKPFFDLATSVVVSIYSNISPDRTAELITTLLIPRLHAAGVRTVYATTEGACLGYVERQSFHERIEWMACIRNKALEPLYEKGMSLADGLVVLFFNDVIFRPQDITALLESRAEAQIAASTRPHGWVSSVTKTNHEPADAGVKDDDGDSRKHPVGTASTPPSGSTSAATGTTFDMACGMDFYATFYDTWVTRDRLGKPFGAQMPYSDDHSTQEAFYRIFKHERTGDHAPEASAIPVKCCWNGVAAIRGRFFLAPTPPHRLGFPVRDAAETTARTPSAASSAPAATGGARSEAAAHHPDVLQRPSGAVYDRIGDVHDLLNTTTLVHYYTRVLARRLQSVCVSWSLMRREIARLADIPFYKPETCDSSSSFESLLHTESVVKAENEGEVEPAVPVALRVEEDSVYYRVRHPSVRFRHAFTPSYGATVAGHALVRDEVCLASECLLICQDVMHAALLQDRRAPIILLNPHVRVAYNLEDFNRVTKQTWFFEHPHVYWVWTLARRMQLWWPPSPSSSVQDKGAGAGGSRELGNATSAMDDWLSTASVAAGSGTVMRGTQKLSVQDGAGRVIATGLIDIPTLTRMDCQGSAEGSIRAQWWRALYCAVWYSSLAQRLRWLSGGVAEGERDAGDVVSGEWEGERTVSGCGYGRARHPVTSSSSALLQQLHRLQSHRFVKNSHARSCVGAAWRAAFFVAQTLVWLLSSLCCVRFWFGWCRAPPALTIPTGCSGSKARQLWPHRSSASPAKSHYPREPSRAVVSADALRVGPAVAGEMAGCTATRRSEGTARPTSCTLFIPRSWTASGGGGNDTEVQRQHHGVSQAATNVASATPAGAIESPMNSVHRQYELTHGSATASNHQMRSRNSNYGGRSWLQFGVIP
ncbi:Cryptococcal mannosyltransferase 1 family protein [Leishmania donovani]|uniref:Cryptococcal mannosyltransferase 1 family protein n=1 Tax=Leishmania donovani TaxID=5661 RepID=A0A504XJQ6_LEIDO|nr:Cryptococcal mannosyltransferase 1 family protein [Leishmania donovani]